MDADQFVVIITSCGAPAEAERIATGLVEARLAACVQAKSIQSTYWWQGKVEQSQEVQLMMKAKRADYRAIEDWIRANHSYQNPEVIAIPLIEGSRPYLDWIKDETREVSAL